MSDCTAGVPMAVQVKRSNRIGPPVLAKWILQGKKDGKAENKPWAVVVCGHYSRHLTITCDFDFFVKIATDAGFIQPLSEKLSA